MSLPSISDDRFQAEVLEADRPVLVDFTASWCPPCRVMAPILDEIDAERDDVRVVKVDTDDNPHTAQRYGVLGLPTFILFRHGEPVLRLTGARPKARLVSELSEVL